MPKFQAAYIIVTLISCQHSFSSAVVETRKKKYSEKRLSFCNKKNISHD